MSNILTIKNLTLSYDGKQNAVENVNLNMENLQIHAILGESGSGKSSLLRLIAGLEKPDSGEIYFNEELISSKDNVKAPEERKFSMVFQEPGLFPHLNLFENVAFGVKEKNKHKSIVNELLEAVGLIDYATRYPHQISGGQAQRIAIARALAVEPQMLLLDEPFSNLDTILKENLRNEITLLSERYKIPIILVSHDIGDALSMADSISVMAYGKLVQSDLPELIYNNPNDFYVGSIFGRVNQLSQELWGKIGGIGQSTIFRAKKLEINDIGVECETLKCRFFGTHYEIKVKHNNEIFYWHNSIAVNSGINVRLRLKDTN